VLVRHCGYMDFSNGRAHVGVLVNTGSRATGEARKGFQLELAPEGSLPGFLLVCRSLVE